MMTVDQLVAELARPIFVLQMAKTAEYNDSPFGRGAHKRAEQARKDIDMIVMNYTGWGRVSG